MKEKLVHRGLIRLYAGLFWFHEELPHGIQKPIWRGSYFSYWNWIGGFRGAKIPFIPRKNGLEISWYWWISGIYLYLNTKFKFARVFLQDSSVNYIISLSSLFVLLSTCNKFEPRICLEYPCIIQYMCHSNYWIPKCVVVHHHGECGPFKLLTFYKDL